MGNDGQPKPKVAVPVFARRVARACLVGLGGTVYGVGVQNNVKYARSDTYGDPGPGGSMLMSLTSGGFSICALEIRGGCDLAEPFELSERNIPKGAVGAIQELTQKVDAGDQKSEDRNQRSETRIRKLELENADLKARLEHLERLLLQTEAE